MGIFKGNKDGGKSFVRDLRPGDYVEVIESGTMSQKEDSDSKEVSKCPRGRKFLIQKFGDSERRAFVTCTQTKEEGWISVENRKGMPLVAPVQLDDKGSKKAGSSDGKSAAVPTKVDKVSFAKQAAAGQYGETLYHVTVRKEEDMDSPILYELGIGVPFKVLGRSKEPGSRRCKVQLLTKNNRAGWISLETRKQEPLVCHISKKNKANLVDAVELVQGYEVGQTHEVKTALRVDEEELVEESMEYFYLHPGDIVEILAIGKRSAVRAKIRSRHENKKTKEGWITLVQPDGDFTIGKVGAKMDTQTGSWKSSKVKNFLFAARDGNLAKLKELSQGSGIFGSSVPINAADAQGKTALIYACAFGRVECAIYLLTRPNVEVNFIDTFNRTALHHACKIGNYRIIEVLVKSGANVNARDYKGHVPLMQLAVIGDMYPDAYKCVQFLLRHYAIVTVQDYNGVSAIDFASSVEDPKMVQLLEGAGAGKLHPGSPKSAISSPKSATPQGQPADVAMVKKKKQTTEAVKQLKKDEKGDNWEAESQEDLGESAEAAAVEKELSPKEQAQSDLDKAVEGADIMDLTNAIEAAIPHGVDVKDAEKRLKEMKAVKKAEDWMIACLEEEKPDVPKLKEALANCQKIHVAQDHIEKWQKKIDKLAPLYEARKALDRAAGPDHIASLEGEIKKYQGVLSKDEMAPYIKKLDEYKNFDAAMKSLKDALRKNNIQAMNDLVKNCRGLKGKMNDEQKKTLDESEKVLAVELPKIEAREKVEKVLKQNPDSPDYIKNLDAVTKEVLKLGIVDKDPVVLQAVKIVKAEKERIRIRSDIKAIMEETKTFSKISDIDQLQKTKDALFKLVSQSRLPEINLPEIEVAPLALRLRKVHNQIEDIKGSIRIYFRSRPLSKNEIDQGAKPALKFPGDGMTIQVMDEESKMQSFALDNVFNPGTQEEVFSEVKDLVQSAFDGYNVTLFAYGQTGAGKTFTMYGAPGNPGVVPRALAEVFKIKEEQTQSQVTVIGSMLELYRSDLSDLLSTKDPKARPPLTVRSDKKGDVYVENAVEEQAMNAKELQAMIDRGFNNRKTAATLMNAESSRSHLIVMVKIVGVNLETNETIKGKLILVDLAGSERLKKSGVEGDNLKEAIEINKSLTALGDVIEQLTSGQKTIGYRNHKLTQVMQDSLGGSAKTLMFCNCSPASINCDETIMTLKWATRAKQVKNVGGAAAKAKEKPKSSPQRKT